MDKKDIALLGVVVLCIGVLGVINTYNMPPWEMAFSDTGRPYCNCQEYDLQEWKQIKDAPVCWLELCSSGQFGYSTCMSMPFYGEPYYWQRFGNMSEGVVKTDCYILWQLCEKHSDDLNCVWMEEEATCHCMPTSN